MKIPPGFEKGEKVGKVCKLYCSLYGLKQSPRAWFKRFSSTLTRFGYKQGEANHTLFNKHVTSGKRPILIVYVDDIIIIGDGILEIAKMNLRLKTWGTMRYFLGIEVVRSKQGILISQRKYTLDLLKDIGMLGSRLVEPDSAVHSIKGTNQ